jgi:hypothetical protein
MTCLGPLSGGTNRSVSSAKDILSPNCRGPLRLLSKSQGRTSLASQDYSLFIRQLSVMFRRDFQPHVARSCPVSVSIRPSARLEPCESVEKSECKQTLSQQYVLLRVSGYIVVSTMPAWRNGYAAACRAAYPGSIPGTGSHFLSLLTP